MLKDGKQTGRFWYFFCQSGCLNTTVLCADGGLAWRFGWCLKGLNCCMFASDGIFVLYILKMNEGAFTLPAQPQLYNFRM